jgi:hypothetical protein
MAQFEQDFGTPPKLCPPMQGKLDTDNWFQPLLTRLLKERRKMSKEERL